MATLGQKHTLLNHHFKYGESCYLKPSSKASWLYSPNSILPSSSFPIPCQPLIIPRSCQPTCLSAHTLSVLPKSSPVMQVLPEASPGALQPPPTLPLPSSCFRLLCLYSVPHRLPCILSYSVVYRFCFPRVLCVPRMSVCESSTCTPKLSALE